MRKTVLVVGAAGGVGSAVVALMLRKGYAVIGTVLNAAEAEAARASSPTIDELVTLDMSDGDAVVATLKQVLAARPIDLAGAIVCAAISPYGPLEITPLAKLRATLEINAVSDVAVYQAAMPHLRESKGRMIMIVSNAGRVAFPFIGHYVASKHALEGLGDVMRQEAKAFGVDVVMIEPGGIRTPMVTNQIKSVLGDRDRLSDEQRALYGDWFDRFHALLHFGATQGLDPAEVAAVIGEALEAAAPKTRYVVGQDSVDTLAMRASSSDEEVDAMFRRAFDGASLADAAGG